MTSKVGERFVEIELVKRGIRSVARLLDTEAPKTCAAIWNALPLGGPVWHAKYASNEIYCLVPPLTPFHSTKENTTITPIPGDLVYFYFEKDELPPVLRNREEWSAYDGVVDLAVFYGRNNLLLNPATGPVPGTVFGSIVENLDAMLEGGNDVWRNGSSGEELVYRRLE